MRVIDVVNGLNRAVLRRVPKQYRAEVRVMLTAIQHIYAVEMDADKRAAFLSGLNAEHQQEAASQQRGFDLGYQHGMNQAIASVGTAALRVDDDQLTREPS